MNPTNNPARAGQILCPVRKPSIIYTPPTTSNSSGQSSSHIRQPQIPSWDMDVSPRGNQAWPSSIPTAYAMPSAHLGWPRPSMPLNQETWYNPPASLYSPSLPMPPFHGQPLHKDYWLNELSQHHIPGVGCSVISPTSEVSTKLSIDATGVKQSKHQKEIESGYRNKWYCPTVSDEDANTAIPTSVNMSIGDNAILVNGIKYIKAESQSHQKSADADPEASAHDISHDEDETTDIQSEQHEDEVEYCGDYNDQDKTCSHVGDWDERWNDHGHQEQALAEGDDAYSNAGVQDAVSTGHGGDDKDDEYHDEGTLENPIQEPSIFDEELVRVVVGIDWFHEHKVLKSAIQTLFDSGHFPEQMEDMEYGKRIVLEGLPNESFGKIVECLYAGYRPSHGTAVVSIFDPCDLIQLYPAARFFHLSDLTTAILEALEIRNCPVDVFRAGQKIYFRDGADQSFRALFRKQLALFLDRKGTNSEQCSNRVIRSSIIRALLNIDLAETCRKDILDVILKREIGRNETKDEQSTGTLLHSLSSTRENTAIRESVSEHVQEDGSHNDTNREGLKQTTNQSGLSAIAIEDHDGDWNENFRFRIGDRISKITFHESEWDGNSYAEGNCHGVSGYFPLSKVRFED